MAIVTAAEYKVYRGIAGSAYDAVLAVLIASAQDSLERVCGRAFESTVYTDEPIDGNGECSLWLPNIPVDSVAAVKSVATDGTTTTLDATSYRLKPSTGELRRLSGDWGWEPVSSPFAGVTGPVWASGVQNYLVTYTAGYSSGAMPSSLKHLMFVLLDSMVDERGGNALVGQTADGIEQRTALAAAELRSKRADLFRPWARVVV